MAGWRDFSWQADEHKLRQDDEPEKFPTFWCFKIREKLVTEVRHCDLANKTETQLIVKDSFYINYKHRVLEVLEERSPVTVKPKNFVFSSLFFGLFCQTSRIVQTHECPAAGGLQNYNMYYSKKSLKVLLIFNQSRKCIISSIFNLLNES